MNRQAYCLALLAAARQLNEAPPLTPQPALPPGVIAVPERRLGKLCIRLWLDPQERTIVAARHEGAEEPALLDVFCRTLEGLSIAEAANYGADYTVHRIALGIPKPGDMGILNPVQALPSLGLAQRILRCLQGEQERAAAADEAACYLALPSSWLNMPAAARLDRIRATVSVYLKETGTAADLLNVDRLENDIRQRPVRVILTHSKGENDSDLPALMRAIERHLRREVTPWLEVYSEERIDRNGLRRMILQESRPA